MVYAIIVLFIAFLIAICFALAYWFDWKSLKSDFDSKIDERDKVIRELNEKVAQLQAQIKAK